MSNQSTAPTIRLIPESPVNPDVKTYTAHGSLFEAFEYTDWIDESMSWKETCYIGDWSPLLKFNVEGPDAQKFFSSIAVNSFASFDIGQAKHMVMCNKEGKVMGEGILMKRADDAFLFTSGPGVIWARYLFWKGNFNATATLIGSFIFQVQGPNSLYVLEEATRESLRDIDFMRFRKSKIKGIEITILRQGMSGDIGYELYGASENGVAIYNAILEAGEKFGIRRLGGRTKMVNHVEACYPTVIVDYMPPFNADQEFMKYMDAYVPEVRGRWQFKRNGGSFEFDDPNELTRNPVELGWKRNIKFDHEFLGRESLEEVVRNPKRGMVTLVWNSDDVLKVYASMFKKGQPYQYMEIPRNPLGGNMIVDKVMKGGRMVGLTTSRCYSYYFREMLSLCSLDVDLCQSGTEIMVVWGNPGKPQKNIRATVAPAPYKEDKRRVDVTKLPSNL